MVSLMKETNRANGEEVGGYLAGEEGGFSVEVIFHPALKCSRESEQTFYAEGTYSMALM